MLQRALGEAWVQKREFGLFVMLKLYKTSSAAPCARASRAPSDLLPMQTSAHRGFTKTPRILPVLANASASPL